MTISPTARPMDLEPRPVQGAPPASVTDVSENEQRLVAAVLQGNRKATAEFVAQYADSIYSYVRHRLTPRQDLVDDVVQEVFLAALDNLRSFRGASQLRSWLLGIARHKVESHYREQLRAPDSLDDEESAEPPARTPAIEDLMEREQTARRTRQVLQRLPPSYGLALLWRYWEGRSAREMAAATGKTEKAIERLLARARLRFKEVWERF